MFGNLIIGNYIFKNFVKCIPLNLLSTKMIIPPPFPVWEPPKHKMLLEQQLFPLINVSSVEVFLSKGYALALIELNHILESIKHSI